MPVGAIPTMGIPVAPAMAPVGAKMDTDPVLNEAEQGQVWQQEPGAAYVARVAVTDTGNLPTMAPDVDLWEPVDRVVESAQVTQLPPFSGDGKVPPVPGNAPLMGPMTGVEEMALDRPSYQRKQFVNYHDGWLAAGTEPALLGGHSTVSLYVPNPSQQTMNTPGWSGSAVSVARSIPGVLSAQLPTQASSGSAGYLDNTEY